MKIDFEVAQEQIEALVEANEELAEENERLTVELHISEEKFTSLVAQMQRLMSDRTQDV